MQLEGIHHITAITGDAPRNVDFYARLLGLRMVKKTVNFDAPEVYHLYYGDERGAAGRPAAPTRSPASNGAPPTHTTRRPPTRRSRAPVRCTTSRGPRPTTTSRAPGVHGWRARAHGPRP